MPICDSIKEGSINTYKIQQNTTDSTDFHQAAHKTTYYACVTRTQLQYWNTELTAKARIHPIQAK